MHKFPPLVLAAILFVMAATVRAQTPPKGPVAYVDPMIGTGIATTESARLHSEAGSEMKAQTYPAVGVPFGMTHWTPQTRATEVKCLSPYYYEDTKINGFRGSHWMSGSCTQDYGSVTIMPITGRLQVSANKRGSDFAHQTERATPAYYAVSLDDYGIRAELTATTRAAMMRFTFRKADQGYIVIQPNSDEGEGFVEIDKEKREISGYNPVHRIYQGWGKPAGFSGYFVIRFDREIEDFGTFRNEVVQTDATSIAGNEDQVGAYVHFPVKAGEVLRLKVGTSFTSIEEARKNLQAEIPAWDFEAVRAATEKSWNNALSKVSVKGSSREALTTFYTALYHSMILPRLYNDHSGTYPAFDHHYETRQTRNFQYYGDFSLWDTFRAIHPLYALMYPDRSRDMVSTLVSMAEEGDWLPIFPCWNSYTAAMIGDHATSVIADAYVKGIRGFDAAKAYQYMRKNALETPEDIQVYRDGKGRRALSSYLQYNYVPLEDSVPDAFHKKEQVSRTLEYAYNDFAVAQLARALGKTDDYSLFAERAANYKHVFDPRAGFMNGRFADGSWIAGTNPDQKEPFITEGTPWQYTWFVPHDLKGLAELMGGRENFVRNLDDFFARKQYWHGNEPGHHIPYLFVYGGEPWKTQEKVAEIRRIEYSTGPGGISGNDDCGQMSAWYVFSALGFYPVCPGLPYYVIGTPAFEEAKLTVGANRNFTITAKNVSDQNVYIQSATLNGKALNRAWLTHQEITNGGTLVFQMGPRPNEQWAADPQQAPPSYRDQ